MHRILILLALCASLALGQSTTGEIHGSIIDPSAAAIPAAEITVTNEDTGETKIVQSGATGDYIVPLLQPGRYRVTVQSEGFRTVERTGLILSAVQSLRVDITLEIGQITETVTVTGQAVQVDTRSTTVGTLVDDRRIQDLPLNGRNVIDLATLAPGIQTVSTTNRPSFGQQTIRMNGGRHFSVNFLMDGGSMNYFHRGQGLVMPPPDAIQEFKLITTGVSAEFGRGFGVLSSVTKSGTNAFHGSLWNFLRNDALDARRFFARSKPKLRYNQFGGTIGGPVQQDRTFFFFSYQGQRIREDRVRGSNPPTQAERSGDFSHLSEPLKNPVMGGTFPGNIIPADRFDPVAMHVLNTWVPLPGADGRYQTQVSQPSDDNQFLVRMDHNIGHRNHLQGRYFYDNNVGADPLRQSSYIDYGPNPRGNRTQTASIEDTHAFSPTLILTLRGTYTRFNYQESILTDDDLASFGATDFVHAGGPVRTRPVLNVSGVFDLGPGRYRQRLSHNYDWSANMSWTKGNHQAKWGIDWQRNRFLYRDNRATGGEFSFNGGQTGDPFADFLIGRSRRIRQSSPLETDHRYTVMGIFFQDSIKIAPNFTFNAGIRSELFPNWKEKIGQMTAFVPGAQSSFIPSAPVGAVWLEDSAYPYKNDYKNFAPRIGLAWDVFGDGRTSVRTSFGVSYDPLTAEMAGGVLPPQPFGLSHTLNVPFALSAPYFGESNPFPFTFDPSNPNFVFPIRMPKSFDPGVSNPYTQSYNFTIQHQLQENLMIEIAYIGNGGRKLAYIAERNPAIYGPGATTRDTNARRPHQGFASIGELQTAANSNYNGLQIELNRRFSRGLTFTIAYTYSKSIDEVLTSSAFAVATQPNGPQNPKDRRADRGNGEYDLRQRWVSSFLYELPYKGSGGPLKWILGGWELGAITTLQDGFRDRNWRSGTDNSRTAVGFDRPNLVGDWRLDTNRSRAEKLEAYFNTAAFVQNAVGTFGNVGRGFMANPGVANFDFSLSKTFTVKEGHSLLFRLDSFNAFNRPTLGAPNTTVRSRSFGRINGTGPGRINQLSLKYVF